MSADNPITYQMIAQRIKRAGEFWRLQFPSIPYNLRHNAANEFDQSGSSARSCKCIWPGAVDNFSRAKTRLSKRCHQISRRYDADVCVYVRRNPVTCNYNPTGDGAFPASLDLKNVYPPADGRTPQDSGEEQGHKQDDNSATDMTGLAEDHPCTIAMTQNKSPH
ncbi:hypothetical protein AAL_03322 [Moelleriella libera RCEF 2490]|uniref:Uncharacterized protein n=1 Tax=Moelleriella libera RCEF 2490 TaxID=1081109 RepID=A0A168D4X9_9HYPO|nr:hypothetical protein AAL_03322 [Moelleriella libera RCEF 2490]